MKRAILTIVTTTLLCTLTASPASAAFGFKALDLAFTDSLDAPAMQAGSHPFAITNTLEANTKLNDEGNEVPDDEFKDLLVDLPPGLVGTPDPVPHCSSKDFLDIHVAKNSCPDSTAVGTIEVATSVTPIPPGSNAYYDPLPVYSLTAPPGMAAKIGFTFLPGLPITIEFGLNPDPPYNLQAHVTDIPQAALFFGSRLTVWGIPADPAHDPERGSCLGTVKSCPVSLPEVPFQTLPRACTGPLITRFEGVSWQNSSAAPVVGETETHDSSEPPQPLGLRGCEKLGFSPSIDAKPTTKAAESSTGLDLSLEVADEGLTSADGLAQSDIEEAVITLPEGMTVNPSSAEGLEACSEADLGRETLSAGPGEGCPEASKLGTVRVDTPLLEGQPLEGSLYLAKPYENPTHSLIALYIVIENQKLGVTIKQTVKVEPDPKTGQLIGTAKDIPQWPFSHFSLHFREGARSPLVSPPACGDYEVRAKLTPRSGNAPIITTSAFKIISGVSASPCPPGGTPPFGPGFQAGANNNQAGAFSPFYMRLTRKDGDQNLTRFSASLPPGMVAKLAGTTQCSDGSIAQAKAKSGESELASPSCPASSQIGRVMAGAGVGAVLTYVPGKVYLAGPYNGAPLSVAAIVPAVAGPFDVGTVVTRQALRIDPRTGKVRVDGAASDPIPHILAGIPLKVRDIRVYVDRPEFTLNPTSCEPFSVAAELWGGGSDVFGSADDSPLGLSERFQAANCASLGFKPRLALKLKGGTKRGGHPALIGTYRPRPGDANLEGLVLRLPRSAFLDQAHIRTICTRVQFAAKSCPPGAIYGHAAAYTPILDQPLEGPVYLRSSDHKLPDFVASLHGLVDVEAVARIDSKRGGIRATFSEVPDAPLSKVVVRMQGAKKGLIVNSTDLCAAKHQANVQLDAHNGMRRTLKPLVGPQCGGKRSPDQRERRAGL